MAPAMPARPVRTAGAASLLVSMSNEYLTSAAVTGSPLVNRAFGFRRNATHDLSGATWMSSASRPYMVSGSSPERTASVSNISVARAAGDWPFTVNGLNLSKLVRRSGCDSCIVPPFGASGFT